MQEDFLHFLWRLKRFNHNGLKTTDGVPIEIVNHGVYNRNAGPDFLNAMVRIGDTLWAGNIEMHLKSSEWFIHGHQADLAYENVILHVVLDDDIAIRRSDGSLVSCLNLRPYLPIGLSKQYLRLLHSEKWIPCHSQFNTVDHLTSTAWMERLLVERLEDRTNSILALLQNNNNDWEETFYQLLGQGFGLRVNTDPFLLLTQRTPLKTLLRHKNDIFQLEALLFGQAGLLDENFEDEYPVRLKKEYQFLAIKYQLQPLISTSWKFMRMRPANFPTIRIAQFARLIWQTGQLFSKMLAAKNIKEIENAFDISLSGYWSTHYRFGKKSKKTNKKLGKNTIHLLVINMIAPFLFLYGKQRDNKAIKEKALDLLASIPAEKNHIIEAWKKLGQEPKSASDTQALLQLKNTYCNDHKCLECAIGCSILKHSKAKDTEVLYLPTWMLEGPAAQRLGKLSPIAKEEGFQHL